MDRESEYRGIPRVSRGFLAMMAGSTLAMGALALGVGSAIPASEARVVSTPGASPSPTERPLPIPTQTPVSERWRFCQKTDTRPQYADDSKVCADARGMQVWGINAVDQTGMSVVHSMRRIPAVEDSRFDEEFKDIPNAVMGTIEDASGKAVYVRRPGAMPDVPAHLR